MPGRPSYPKPARVLNFASGPSTLPEEVLRDAQEDLWSFRGSGIGILEHHHRGPHFQELLAELQADCRELAALPEDFEVLLLHGGARLQFAMLPANLLPADGTADYLDTGFFAGMALEEARHYGGVHVAASSRNEDFRRLPSPGETRFSDSPVYVHFTSNNTACGTQLREEPTPPGGSWLACDASSDLFTRPLAWERYGLVYSGSHKNLGTAGLALVMARRALLEAPVRELPAFLRYATHLAHGSCFNTPPVFAVYVMGRMLRWMLAQGGLDALARRGRARADFLYGVIDGSDFYSGLVHPDSRSRVNVTFRTPHPELDARFLAEAEKGGMVGLTGYRRVGGLRANLYNALPAAACETLAEFMREFERRYG